MYIIIILFFIRLFDQPLAMSKYRQKAQRLDSK